MYNVINIETGETLGQFDSLYLAKKMVCTINRSCGRKIVRVIEIQ